NRDVFVRILEMLGCTVETAWNGYEALEALQNCGPFDVVFMDCHMPEMDGYEATRRVREREVETGSHQVIVAMTAYAMPGDRERCLSAGMDDYVSKPFVPDDLLAVLRRWVG
ncbi:MAG: response regulator, partial [Candidatus Eremiobacterota bacterium]